jgi:hypothetical protein
MSSGQNNHNGKGRLPESNSSTNEIHQLRLYYVRMHETKHELNIEANFGSKIKFTFDKGKKLDYNSFSPFIYILDLVLKTDNSEGLMVQHDGSWKQVDEYYLEIPRTIVRYGTITHEEKGSQGHLLSDCFENEHHFLFDIQFLSKYGTHVPGKNLQTMSGRNL